MAEDGEECLIVKLGTRAPKKSFGAEIFLRSVEKASAMMNLTTSGRSRRR
jgi:hypothetical protein